jgi:hypothetical protein
LKYFLKKWRRSLSIKQRLYPQQYDFSSLLATDSIREMTERLLANYSSYSGAKEYFKGYTLVSGDLQAIPVPTTIITAQDDPIIPVEDFYDLHTNQATRLLIQPYGGHNGFLKDWRLCGWYEHVMVECFKAAAR